MLGDGRYFGLILIALTTGVTIIVSYSTPPPPPEQLQDTTYWKVITRVTSKETGKRASSAHEEHKDEFEYSHVAHEARAGQRVKGR